MTDIRKVSLPRIKYGAVMGEDLSVYMELLCREIFAKFDARNAQSDFASGILANLDGSVTLGTGAIPSGRTVAVPTLFTYIGDGGRAASQRFAYPVQTANRNSVQSVDSILTASSGASTSTISVASHSVKFDFGSVSYSSGSVTGLTPETTYLVYAVDASYAGGAVTYLATTSPDNLIVAGAYYVGYITTPIAGTSNTILAATNANPVEFTTTTNHGWSSTQSVDFASFADANWTAFNTGNYVITVTAVNKFTVATDTTTYGAYTPSTATATRVTTSVQSGGGAGGGSGGGGSTGTRWDGLTSLP